MRLLNVHTRKLEEFYDTDTPPYAILSHVWGDDEVTFSDIMHGDGSKKDAFRKIRFLCIQAVEDALNYAWLDTCCINKDSSAELSEAINSMYRWYYCAKCCYAYLADIPAEIQWDIHGINLLEHDPWIMKLADSKWFTRGWTLQELLAPRYQKFYGEKWNYIGDRDDLAPVLARITKIREEVLKSPEELVLQCSVAEKMSWAATRKTSRIEDKAYCLLGIFQVNMPMLYGEGDRAFLRLQEEIIKSTDDHSIFVWQPQRPEEWHLLLAPSPDRFMHGDLIVTIPSLHHVDGHTLGNTGLRITLPIAHTGIGDYWHAVLGCRYRDDYQNIIVLCLKNRVKGVEAPTTLYVSPTIARSQRYVVQRAPQESDDLPASQTFIITRTLPKAETLSQTAGAKYWFDIEETSTINISAAYPVECFNAQTRVMNLSGSQIKYGAILVPLPEVLAQYGGYDESSWHARSLAIVFGGWTAPDTATDAMQDQIGIFGVVQSNLKNLPNACRFAVSQSIYRSAEASQHHVAWVRSVYAVPWSSTHILGVAFKADQEIGMLHEVVNVISIQLYLTKDNKVTLMPLLQQSKEPIGNPLSVQRLQDVVQSMSDEDAVEGASLDDEAPQPGSIYELEDDSWRAQPPEEPVSDDEAYVQDQAAYYGSYPGPRTPAKDSLVTSFFRMSTKDNHAASTRGQSRRSPLIQNRPVKAPSKHSNWRSISEK